MNRFWVIVLSVVGWVAIITYLVVATRLCSREQKAVMVKGVNVVVQDSAIQSIITPAMVRLWIEQSDKNLRNKSIADINTSKMRELVLGHAFVKEADVFADINGFVNIRLTQRHPIARVNCDGGYNFYITSDGYILPLQNHFTVYVPIVTGSFTPPFVAGYIGHWEGKKSKDKKNIDKNHIFFGKLINFVELIRGEEFWNAQIVQINVIEGGVASSLQEPLVEIVPRAGNHIICIGTVDDVEEKLDKLLIFYRNALDYEGWSSVRYIDLSYKNQIVCKK